MQDCWNGNRYDDKYLSNPEIFLQHKQQGPKYLDRETRGSSFEEALSNFEPNSHEKKTIDEL